MLEKALIGSKKYWGWLFFLLVVLLVGAANYLRQLDYGLGITGMSRDVTWALYIAQFTFLVGVAASAVMLVLPYYLHNYKAFGRITILGEFLAVASVVMCLTFIIVDLGQPARAFNMIIYPTPSSILFWDMIVLNGYLLLNIVIGWTVLDCGKKRNRPSQVGQNPDLRLHPLGHQHPYGDGVYLRRPSRQKLLAYSHHGAAISGLGLRLRPGAV